MIPNVSISSSGVINAASTSEPPRVSRSRLTKAMRKETSCHVCYPGCAALVPRASRLHTFACARPNLYVAGLRPIGACSVRATTHFQRAPVC